MAKGYFLTKDNRTSCGGVILEGDPIMKWHGQPAAREGDKVTCGQHSGVYQITGGISNMEVNGRRLAGTLDSRSSCPCRAQLLPATHADFYNKEEQPLKPVISYGWQLLFHCQHTQKAVSDFAYSFQADDQEINGITDGSGKSQHILTGQPQTVQINYLIQTRIGL